MIPFWDAVALKAKRARTSAINRPRRSDWSALTILETTVHSTVGTLIHSDRLPLPSPRLTMGRPVRRGGPLPF